MLCAHHNQLLLTSIPSLVRGLCGVHSIQSLSCGYNSYSTETDSSSDKSSSEWNEKLRYYPTHKQALTNVHGFVPGDAVQAEFQQKLNGEEQGLAAASVLHQQGLHVFKQHPAVDYAAMANPFVPSNMM